MQPAWPRAGVRLDDRKSTIYFDNYTAMHERTPTEHCCDRADLRLTLLERTADPVILVAHFDWRFARHTTYRGEWPAP